MSCSNIFVSLCITGGAVAGHGVATAIAVAGGGFLTRYVSAGLLQYLGGSLFLVFAATTLVDVAQKVTSEGTLVAIAQGLAQ